MVVGDNSDNADSVDLFVLPGVSAERGRRSEPASSTSLLPDMVGVPATPSASDMGTLSSSFPERCGPFCHEPWSSESTKGLKIKLPSTEPANRRILFVLRRGLEVGRSSHSESWGSSTQVLTELGNGSLDLSQNILCIVGWRVVECLGWVRFGGCLEFLGPVRRDFII